VTLFLCAPLAGALTDRIGERPLMAGGLALQAAGLVWVAAIAAPGMSYGALVPALVIAGCGVSMALPAVQNSVVSAVGHADIGKAAGTNSTMRELGGVFGIAVAVAVFARSGEIGSADEFIAGFGPAITVAAGLSLLGAVAGLWLPGRRTQPIT
jgi:MFS family permease